MPQFYSADNDLVEFPDDMPEQDVLTSLRKKYTPSYFSGRPEEPATSGERLQGIISGVGENIKTGIEDFASTMETIATSSDRDEAFAKTLEYIGPGGILSMGSKFAKSFDPVQAQGMIDNIKGGGDPRAAWTKYRYGVGQDQKIRFEISDEASDLKHTPDDMRSMLKERSLWGKEDEFLPKTGDITEKPIPVKEFLSHEELIEKNYPHLGDIQVKMHRGRDKGAAYYSDASNTISINEEVLKGTSKIDKNTVKSLMLHELDHAVQSREGMALGGSAAFWDKQLASPTMSKARLNATKNEIAGLERDIQEANAAGLSNQVGIIGEKLDKAQGQAVYDKSIVDLVETAKREGWSGKYIYDKLLGEVSANNVQARMNLTSAERGEKLPAWLLNRTSIVDTFPEMKVPSPVKQRKIQAEVQRLYKQDPSGKLAEEYVEENWKKGVLEDVLEAEKELK